MRASLTHMCIGVVNPNYSRALAERSLSLPPCVPTQACCSFIPRKSSLSLALCHGMCLIEGTQSLLNNSVTACTTEWFVPNRPCMGSYLHQCYYACTCQLIHPPYALLKLNQKVSFGECMQMAPKATHASLHCLFRTDVAASLIYLLSHASFDSTLYQAF